MLTLTACNNNSADMYSYSDGSGNTYFITETTITYSPVTPLESSSGLYSGGEPANITIDKATFQNVVSLLEGFEVGADINPRRAFVIGAFR